MATPGQIAFVMVAVSNAFGGSTPAVPAQSIAVEDVRKNGGSSSPQDLAIVENLPVSAFIVGQDIATAFAARGDLLYQALPNSGQPKPAFWGPNATIGEIAIFLFG